MSSRIRVAVCLALGWLVAAGVASAATTAASGPPAVRKMAPRASAKGTGVRAAGKTEAAGAKRTLQDIHIEGEIPVPQVMFITARNQRRFLDFQQWHYLRTSRQLGEQTVLPSWIGVTGNHPTDTRKENSR